MYKRLISNNKMFNNWDFMIRGPEHQKSGYKSIWYAPEERPESY